MGVSFFNSDLAFEQVMANYLDHHLYFNPLFTEHKRLRDSDSQNKGIDIILSSNEFGLKSSKVDEKCAAHYCNKDLQSFAFELMYVKDNALHLGWFIDSKKETEAYMLVWPFIEESLGSGKVDSISERDITGVRYLIIKRDKLSAYLSTRGFTRERMLKDAQRLMNGEVSSIDTKYPQFHYFKSEKYAESPVNIVVRRSTLWRLADMKGDVVGNILTPINDW